MCIRDRAEAAAALAGPLGRVALPVDVATADMVVNATSIGMAGTSGEGHLPLDAGLIGPDHLVVDLVYEPGETPLLAASRAQGAVVLGGLGMLVHQAALAFTRWTGQDAPLEAMRAAAEAGLAARQISPNHRTSGPVVPMDRDTDRRGGHRGAAGHDRDVRTA